MGVEGLRECFHMFVQIAYYDNINYHDNYSPDIDFYYRPSLSVV